MRVIDQKQLYTENNDNSALRINYPCGWIGLKLISKSGNYRFFVLTLDNLTRKPESRCKQLIILSFSIQLIDFGTVDHSSA